MGQSSIPIYAYVDETGNTGKNIFDPAQPNFLTAALVTKGNFDVAWGPQIRALAQRFGSNAIHANELGLGRLEAVAGDLLNILERSNAHFFLSRVEKRYLLAAKMFDVLFDSGENAAVAWHNYNIRPLKIMLAFKLAHVIDDSIARDFWDCLLLPREADSRKRLPAICQSLKDRLHLLPDQRSREVLGQGLDWVIIHPEAIHFANEQKVARQGHYPNLVAFSNLLRGLQQFSQRWNRKVAQIAHDEQSEFGRALQTWHSLFSNAAPDIIEWVGERFSLQLAPGSKFVTMRDEQSAGIQMADVALWLYGQAIRGKTLPEKCEQILLLVFERGWRDDFSFAGVERSLMNRWENVFSGTMDEAKLNSAKRLLAESEARRRSSMAQFEADGLAPFMRSSTRDGSTNV